MSTPTEPIAKGTLIGMIAVLLLLAILGLYVWGSISSKKQSRVATSTTEISVGIAEAEPDMAGHAPAQGSDELSSIEADLQSAKADPIETDLDAIEAELN